MTHYLTSDAMGTFYQYRCIVCGGRWNSTEMIPPECPGPEIPPMSLEKAHALAVEAMETARKRIESLESELSRIKAARNQYETKISELRAENISIGAEYQALQTTAATVADIAEQVSNRNQELETALKLASYFVFRMAGNNIPKGPLIIRVPHHERQHARTTLGLVNRLLGLDNAASSPSTPTTPEN